MKLSGLKEGDIVLCDVRGMRFHAFVQDGATRPLAVMPLDHKRISHRSVTARQVIGHWRKSGASRLPMEASQ